MRRRGDGGLTIRLFGRFEVLRGRRPIPNKAWGRAKTQKLFKILLSEPGRPFTHEQLVEPLYPTSTPEKVIRNLRGRVSELRRALEPALTRGRNSRFILHVRGGYCLNPEAPYRLDTEVFQQLLEGAQRLEGEQRWEEARKRYEEALALYRGEFLAEDRYEDWTQGPRRYWRERHLAALSQLAECYAHLGHYGRAVERCRKILALEPYRESAYRQLMLYHYSMGDKGKALLTYKQCLRALKEHLDVRPSLETHRLYEHICAEKTPKPLDRPAAVAVSS